jgi:hypothetical protein
MAYVSADLGKVSFRSAARPVRPEVNARQRCAPSGANLFGALRSPHGRIVGRREGNERHVRQSVGKAWRHSRPADAARRADGSRCRCGDARGSPRAAGGRRRARCRARLRRQGSRAGDRRHRHQVGHARPDGRQDRPRPACRNAWLRQPDNRSQCARAHRHHDGRPAGLRQNHHHRETVASLSPTATAARC